jgi:hypothetical protein
MPQVDRSGDILKAEPPRACIETGFMMNLGFCWPGKLNLVDSGSI